MEKAAQPTNRCAATSSQSPGAKKAKSARSLMSGRGSPNKADAGRVGRRNT